jgi:hypothetical protein
MAQRQLRLSIAGTFCPVRRTHGVRNVATETA